MAGVSVSTENFAVPTALDTTSLISIRAENDILIDTFMVEDLTLSAQYAMGKAKYRYRYNGKEISPEVGSNVYDYGARLYNSGLAKFMSVDPLAGKFANMSPYATFNNNPLFWTDPTGMAASPPDWVEKKDGSIAWDDKATSQATTKKGEKYLGKAVVKFKGSRDEKLGKGDNLFGKGANLADVTVYGPGGGDDVSSYKGFTMSSDFSKFGAVDDGTYNVNFKSPGKNGALKSNWAVENTNYVNALDGVNPNPDGTSKTQKNGIYIHRSNNDGYAGGHCSTGCLLVVPSVYDKKGGLKSSGWDQFNKQLGGVTDFKLILTGRRK